MIMKTISTMPESQRRARMMRLSELVKEGRSISDISSELRIPESENYECTEWIKTINKSNINK